MKLGQDVGHLRLSINPPQEHPWSGQVFSDDCQINSTPSVLTGANCLVVSMIVIAL